MPIGKRLASESTKWSWDVSCGKYWNMWRKHSPTQGDWSSNAVKEKSPIVWDSQRAFHTNILIFFTFILRLTNKLNYCSAKHTHTPAESGSVRYAKHLATQAIPLAKQNTNAKRSTRWSSIWHFISWFFLRSLNIAGLVSRSRVLTLRIIFKSFFEQYITIQADDCALYFQV